MEAFIHILNPMTILILFIAIAFIVLFVALPLSMKKKSKKLLDFFNATFHFPLGTIEFKYNSNTFYISREARGGGYTGVSGSFPALWAYVEKYPKFIIGNSQSKKFTRGQFLILPPNELINCAGQELLIGSNDVSFISRIKSDFINSNLEIKELFRENFAHLTVAQEIHINGLKLFQKKYVFRYTCLPEEIYQNPTILELRLKTILGIFSQLGLKFDKLN